MVISKSKSDLLCEEIGTRYIFDFTEAAAAASRLQNFRNPISFRLPLFAEEGEGRKRTGGGHAVACTLAVSVSAVN